MAFVFPFIPTLVRSFGGTENQVAHRVAVLSSLAAIGEMIGSPIVGFLSDRFGRRPVLLASTLGSACSCVVLGFCKNLPVAVLARLVNGLSGSTVGIANTCLIDMTDADERPGYMSKITSFVGIGLALGPIAGGYLYQLGGVEVACMAAAGISMLNWLVIFFFLAESVQITEAGAQEAPTPQAGSLRAWLVRQLSGLFPKFPAKLWILFVACFFASPISVVFDTFGNIYIADRFYEGRTDQATIFFSHCMSAIGACLLIVPLVIYKPFLRCVGFNGSIVAGFGTVIIGLIGNGLAPDPLSFLVATTVWAFGFQLMGPVLPMLMSRLASPSAIGSAMGMLNSFGNASRAIGPTALAPLYNANHACVFFLLAASLAVVFIIIFGIALSTSDVSPQNQAASETEADAEAPVSLAEQFSLPGTRSYETYGSLPEQLQEVKHVLGPLQLGRATSLGSASARTVRPQLQRAKSEGSGQRTLALLTLDRGPKGPALV